MADVPNCQNMAAWWSMGFITSWRCEISHGKSEKIHNCPPKKMVILHPKHPFKEWSSSRHIPWNQGFHREDSDSPNNLVSSQQLGELLRWRPFLFVRRLTGLCDFFGCWGDLFWAETLGDFFSEVLEIDNLTSQKFQSNMGWFYGSSGYIWRVKDGRFGAMWILWFLGVAFQRVLEKFTLFSVSRTNPQGTQGTLR